MDLKEKLQEEKMGQDAGLDYHHWELFGSFLFCVIAGDVFREDAELSL